MKADKLILVLTLLLGLSSYAFALESEDSIYRGYLGQFMAMKDPKNTNALLPFLSKAARMRLAQDRSNPPSSNMSPAPTDKELLEMAQKMRPYPPTNLVPVKTVTNGLVSLTYKWHEPPGASGFGANGSDVTILVELVNEGSLRLKSESWTMQETAGTAVFKGNADWSY